MFIPRKDPKDLKPGHEQLATVFEVPEGRSPMDSKMVYDYKDADGQIFTCIAENIDDARRQTREWFQSRHEHPAGVCVEFKELAPFKPLQLVKVKLPKSVQNHAESRTMNTGYPFKNGEMLLWLGGIPQMPGHCVVVNKNGKVLWGYHTDNFVEPDEDDI